VAVILEVERCSSGRGTTQATGQAATSELQHQRSPEEGEAAPRPGGGPCRGERTRGHQDGGAAPTRSLNKQEGGGAKDFWRSDPWHSFSGPGSL